MTTNDTNYTYIPGAKDSGMQHQYVNADGAVRFTGAGVWPPKAEITCGKETFALWFFDRLGIVASLNRYPVVDVGASSSTISLPYNSIADFCKGVEPSPRR